MEMETSISGSKVQEDFEQIDIDSIKFEAIFQLKTWQKKMHDLVDQTYQNRLHEINAIAADRLERMQNIDLHDEEHHEQIYQEVEQLKSNIRVIESIPENFSKRIERTVRIDDEEEEMVAVDAEDVDEVIDDEPVIVDIGHDQMKHEDRITVVFANPPSQRESTASKVLNYQPVQHVIGVTLARALTHVGTIAATSTTTAAATTMAKTVVIAAACGVGTVAYGVGKIAIGTTKKVWSLVASSDD